MDVTNVLEMKPRHSDYMVGDLQVIARRPKSISETGLGKHFLQELVVKHLSEGGKTNLRQLSGRLALAGPILENILNAMRKDAWIEVLGPASDQSSLRYALTDRGRAAAAEALLKSGYIGPAPVPLDRYNQVVRVQSVHLQQVTKSDMQNAFASVVVDEDLIDQLGSAVHSGRAIFVYGSPGTGKTFLCQRLAWLFQDAVLVPHAIVIDNTVVQVYDPSIHKPINYLDSEPTMMLGEGFDPRFVLCQR
ncbi:MAG: AAA family ATPase, partial [Gammaproteobacteria bacterium]